MEARVGSPRLPSFLGLLGVGTRRALRARVALRRLGAQRHDELGAEAGRGAHVEGAFDRGAPGADVPQALAGAVAAFLEAAAVVARVAGAARDAFVEEEVEERLLA